MIAYWIASGAWIAVFAISISGDSVLDNDISSRLNHNFELVVITERVGDLKELDIFHFDSFFEDLVFWLVFILEKQISSHDPCDLFDLRMLVYFDLILTIINTDQLI